MTSRSLHSSPSLFSDELESSFGDQRFVIRVDKNLKCYEVIVEGQNPLPVFNVLSDQISQVIRESMKSLQFVFLVRTINTVDVFINVDYRLAVRDNKITSLDLKRTGSNNLLTAAALKDVFKNWITDNHSLTWHDFFISYRWGNDSVFVKAFASCLFNSKCVGVVMRLIRIFLDTESLKVGENFKVIIIILLNIYI